MSEKLCAYCKTNPATNRYERQTPEGTTTEFYCLACYRKVRELETQPAQPSKQSEEKGPSKCPNCGYSVQLFKKTNLVGCEHCYKALSWAIEPVIQRMQGNEPHCGKQQILSHREQLIRRYHAVGIISENVKEEEAEPYLEELKRLQTLLSNKENV